ncbi:MAG TPA: glycosyltransferase family 1 protein, partial [Planctomycetaceae bacterium]|nr:glycosyltransferase family 1 protein [Planctomycetaceae bacterium]
MERYQHGICVAHVATGQNVTAWVQSRDPVGNDLPYPVIAYASPDSPRRRKLRQLQSLAAERFRNRDFTFVSHHASVSSSLVPLLHRIPHVVHFHGPWADEAAIEGAPRWKTFLQRRAERKAYHSADRIITLSTAFAQLIVERYGVSLDVVRVVPGAIDAAAADPGISRTEARQRLGWPTDRPILISIRRLVKRVGIDVLIEATRQLVARHPDLLVLIGGTGPLQGELA